MEIKTMKLTQLLTHRTLHCVMACIAVSLLVLPAQAQDGDQAPKVDDKPVVINPFAEQSESDAERMIRLFQEVEQRMNRSTQLLFDASKGDVGALDQVKGSNLEELGRTANANPRAAVSSLLTASQEEGAQIISAIDEILEIAARNGGT
ncbi:MAG: hypothetical protein CMJ86_10330 [Planctomycetes bacterium]|nr:hypothetical protein [Planctomycetota bacterium]